MILRYPCDILCSIDSNNYSTWNLLEITSVGFSKLKLIFLWVKMVPNQPSQRREISIWKTGWILAILKVFYATINFRWTINNYQKKAIRKISKKSNPFFIHSAFIWTHWNILKNNIFILCSSYLNIESFRSTDYSTLHYKQKTI